MKPIGILLVKTTHKVQPRLMLISIVLQVDLFGHKPKCLTAWLMMKSSSITTVIRVYVWGILHSCQDVQFSLLHTNTLTDVDLMVVPEGRHRNSAHYNSSTRDHENQSKIWQQFHLYSYCWDMKIWTKVEEQTTDWLLSSSCSSCGVVTVDF